MRDKKHSIHLRLCRSAFTLLNAIRPIHSVQVTLRKPFKKSAQMSPRAKKKRGRLDEAEMEKGYPAVVWCARWAKRKKYRPSKESALFTPTGMRAWMKSKRSVHKSYFAFCSLPNPPAPLRSSPPSCSRPMKAEDALGLHKSKESCWALLCSYLLPGDLPHEIKRNGHSSGRRTGDVKPGKTALSLCAVFSPVFLCLSGHIFPSLRLACGF